MSPIKPKEYSFWKEYHSQRLPPVFVHQESEDTLETTQLYRLSKKDLLNDLEGAKQTIFLSIDVLEDIVLIEHLLAKANRGIRVYLLLGDESKNLKAIDQLSGFCLIRTGVTQHGCLFLIDYAYFEEQKGWIGLSRSLCSDSEPLYIWSLNNVERNHCYTSFVKLFWEYAKVEYKHKNKKTKIVQKNPDQKDILVYHSNHLPNGNMQKMLEDDGGSLVFACVQGNGASYKEVGNVKRILSTKTKKSVLQKLIKSTDKVALVDVDLPNIFISNESAWVCPSDFNPDDVNWCVRVEKEQQKSLREACTQLWERCAWKFSNNIKLGDISVGTKLRFVDTIDEIHTSQESLDLPLGDKKTSSMDEYFQSVDDHTKALVVWKKEALALRIKYSITIHPPYLPAKANEDSLYSDWDKTKIRWRKKLEQMRHRLESARLIKQQEESLVASLKSFFLAKDRVSNTIEKSIASLEQWNPIHATRAERKENIDRCIADSNKIDVLCKDIDSAIDKEKCRKEWSKKTEKLKKEKEDWVRKMNKAKVELSNFEQEKTQKIEHINDRFVQSFHNHRNDIPSSKYDLDELSTFQLEQIEAWYLKRTKQQLKKLPDSIKYLGQNQIQALKSVEKKHKMYVDALKSAEVELADVELSLEELGTAFVYHGKDENNELQEELGIKKEKEEEFSIEWPKEELPDSRFTLYSHKKQRFLLIKMEEELEDANKYALELGANIVVQEQK